MKPKQKPHMVPCLHCKGTGQRPLSMDMMLTIDAVKFLSVATASEVATAILWKGSDIAINNRLARLVKYGWLKRRKSGRAWVYLYHTM